MASDKEKAYARALAAHQGRLALIFSQVRDEEKAKIKQWEEEKPNLELLIGSLKETRSIIKKEKKRLATDLAAKASTSASAAAAGVSPLQGRPGQARPQGSGDGSANGKDAALLQRTLDELNSRLAATDIELAQANKELAECDRADERDYLSTKCVVLQDTRRILADEVASLHSDMARIESSHRVEAERRAAEDSGWAEVARLEESLDKVTARLDRAKQQLYFPEAKGYRFSSGNGGIYMAARDLHLNEISGRFEFNVEPIRRRGGAAAGQGPRSAAARASAGGAAAGDTTRVARLTVVLGGVSASTAGADRAESRRATSTNGGPPRDASSHGQHRASGSGATATLAAAAAAAPLTPASSYLSGADDLSSEGGSPTRRAPPGPGPGPVGRPSLSGAPPAPDPQGTRNSTDSLDITTALGYTPPASALAHLGAQATGSPAGSPVVYSPTHGQPPPSAPSARVTHSRPLPGPGAPSPLGSTHPHAQHPINAPLHHHPLPGQHPQHANMHPHPHPHPHLPATHGSMAAPPRPEGKGEAVANFLSGLKNKKEKLKSMIAGDKAGPGQGQGLGAHLQPHLQQQHSGSSGYGLEVAGSSPSRSAGSRMFDKLQDGLSEGKGKLSRVAKAIATKAPGTLHNIRTKLRPGGGSGSVEGQEDGSVRGGVYGGAYGSLGGSDSPVTYVDVEEMDLFGATPLAAAAASTAAGMGAAAAAVTTSRGGAGPSGGGVSGGGGGGGGREPDLSRTSNASTASTASVVTAVAAAPPLGIDGGGSGMFGAAGGGGKTASSKSLAPGGASSELSDGSHLDSMDDALLGGFVEDFQCRPSRRGLYVQLLAERVELLGERGTKVPDMSIRELMLELEVAATATFEYHTAGGAGGGGAWLAPEPVAFSILQLDHRMRGNTIPLPKTLLKGLLNAYMPGMLTRLLSGLLPVELGAYTGACGEAQALSGELKVAGPSLSTTVANIAPGGKPPTDPAKRARWSALQAAAGRARAMLGLGEGQAAALAELFGGNGRPSLVPEGLGITPSISGLCRFYVGYSGSKLWGPLMTLMDRALQDAFEFHGVPQADRFPLPRFLDGPVVRLVRKPLRIAFSLERLGLAVDADAALGTLRDFFERLAREFEAKSAKTGRSAGDADGPSGPPREPLEVQLELLDLWHASLAKLLRAFKARFRSAGCTLLAAADRNIFQVGVESVAYDGPLKLKLPLDLATDPDGSFVLDIQLPDREQANHSITSLLTEVMYSLSATHNTHAAAAAGASATAAVAAAAAAAATSGMAVAPPPPPPPPLTHASMARAVVEHGALAAEVLAAPPSVAAEGVGPLAAAGAAGSPMLDIGQELVAALAEGVGPGGQPLLANPVVGQLSIKKLALNLTLDEERLVQLLAGVQDPTAGLPGPLGPLAPGSTAATAAAAALAGSADIASRLLSCYGNLFTASLDQGWRPTSESDGAPQRPCCMLTVANNDITRVRAELEGLWFQSSVPPRLAVRVLQAVVIALTLKFHASDSYSIRFWNKAFGQIHEYLSRGSLDVAACLSLRATMDRARDKLKIELSGQDLNSGPAGGGSAGGSGGQGARGGEGSGSGSGLLGKVCPVYVVNDVNLMTVLDTMKLLSESGAAAVE